MVRDRGTRLPPVRDVVIWLVGTALAQDAFRFAVIGDPQTDGDESSINWDVLPQLIEDMNARNPDLLLVAGDLVGGAGTVPATVAQWDDFQTATAAFSGTVYAVPGNHDVYGGAGTFDAWRSTFGFPTDDSPAGEEGVSYVVDHGNTRFVFVTSDQESGGTGLSSAALAWMDKVLSEADAFEHVYVTTHHPVSFSTESSIGGTQGDFWQLMVAYGVEGTFMGHWHRYQPSQPGGGGPTWETIIGTGGGWTGYEPIRPYQQRWGWLEVEVDGAYAQATFFGDADGDGHYDDALDSYVLDPGGPTDGGLVLELDLDVGLANAVAGGKALDGTLIGDATQADGWLELDGDGDAAELGGIGDYVLAGNGDLAISTRVRIDSLASGQWANALLCYGTNDYYTEDEETNYSFWLSVREDGTLRAFWEHGDGSNVVLESTATAELVDGTFHDVALTRAGDVATFFVDGEQLGAPVPFTEPPSGGGRGLLYLGSDTRSYIGNESDLDGAMDHLCIWDRSLSGAQVAARAAGTACAELRARSDSGSDSGSNTGSDSTVADDSAPPDGGDRTPTVELEPRCGCAAAPAPVAALGLLGVLLARRRRR